MSSNAPSDRSVVGGELDLDRDLPTTPEDVGTQRRLRREQKLTPQERKAFLVSFAPRPYEELRARKGPGGEPFEL